MLFFDARSRKEAVNRFWHEVRKRAKHIVIVFLELPIKYS